MPVCREETRARSAAGQASVELLAVLPALIVCVVIAAHALSVGWALWSAAGAARAGARAAHVDGDAEAAARRSLPGALERDAEVKVGDGARVAVRPPGLLPGVEVSPIGVAARLEPGRD